MVLFKSQIGFYVRLKTFQRANINDAALLVCRNHFFYYGKSWNGKRYSFANVKFICHYDRANSIETDLQTGFSKAVLIEMSKSFPDQMAKTFHICKWISFAIWTLTIIEKIASGYFYTWIQIVSRLDWLRGGGSLFYYGDHKVDYFHQDATWKALESIPSEKIIDGLRWKGGVGLMEFSTDIKMSQICRSGVWSWSNQSLIQVKGMPRTDLIELT